MHFYLNPKTSLRACTEHGVTLPAIGLSVVRALAVIQHIRLDGLQDFLTTVWKGENGRQDAPTRDNAAVTETALNLVVLSGTASESQFVEARARNTAFHVSLPQLFADEVSGRKTCNQQA